MLKSLKISNFAVIQNLEIDFQPGLNVLTGETGSGKSIIVDALSLLLGARSSGGHIRTGERLASVEALFKLSAESEARVHQVLTESGVEKEAMEDVLVRRELYESGRSRNFVNDQSVTASALRLMQPFLVEIHGQGEQRALLSRESHMEILDSFGGCLPLRDKVTEAFSQWRSASKALSQLEGELKTRERVTDLLEYELKDINTIAPRPGEDEELNVDKRLLIHTEKLLQSSAGAYAELYESDESILSRLAVVRRQLEELNEIDARVGPSLETVLNNIIALTDVAEALRVYGSSIEFSPARLAEVEERLAELERLKRKYDTDLPGVLKYRDELVARLAKWSDLSSRTRALSEDVARARQAYISHANKLSVCRRKAGPNLAERVLVELKEVAMEHARFIVSIKTMGRGGEAVAHLNGEEASDLRSDELSDAAFFNAHGADEIEFLMSANVGEELRPLMRVASGGELSRLMLTLRLINQHGAGGTLGGETLVFDEIDVGISGRVAEAVGRRLKNLSAARQVLCVTHQPQIARFADHHYVISKKVRDGRTFTNASILKDEERVAELARMIGGADEAVATQEAARWLLKSAKSEAKQRLSDKKGSGRRATNE